MTEKRKPMWKGAAIIGMIAVVLAAAVFGGYRFVVSQRLEGFRLLTDFASRDRAELQVSLEGTLADTPLELSFPLFRNKSGDAVFYGTQVEGTKLYLCGNAVYLESGQGFSLAGELPEWEKTLEQVGLLFSAGSVRREKQETQTLYRAEANLEQARSILGLIAPDVAEKMSVIDSLAITLTARQEALLELLLEAAGGKNQLTLRLTVLEAGTLDTDIPQAVLDAREHSGEMPVLRWNPDMIPLLRGGVSLARCKQLSGSLDVNVEMSVLSMAETLTVEYDLTAVPPVGCIRKGELAVYFSGNKLCTAGGTVLTEIQEAEMNYGRMLLLAVPLLLEGKVDCIRQGDKGIYTMVLTPEELEELGRSAGIQVGGESLTLTQGVLEVRVYDNWLESLRFTCGGTMPVLMIDVPVSMELTLRPDREEREIAIPDAVREALK